ncbi:STAS domain-containing protein [uncultured Jatrophihabitans sp.]|uniref:STAS domain-containing protein n=1 Tax=uncultured Jatrophihabitans sp. TaxID=1610747 RepID=UPI0035CAC1FF
MNESDARSVMTDLYFDLRVDYRSRRIAVHGGIDIACGPNVATAVVRLQRAAPGDITIQLDEVTFIDMAGLGILVGARSAQQAGGHRLIVSGASPQVRRIFTLGALDDLLDSPGSTIGG